LPSTAAVSIPNAARYWAIYMSNLHGDVSPGMLAKATGLSTARAAAIRTDLIAANVLKPTRIIAQTTATKVATQDNLIKSARKVFETLREAPEETNEPSEQVENPTPDTPADP